MSTTTTEIPGYVTGSWTIDPVHSDVSFTVRHMMVSKVRGRFTSVSGTIVTATDPLASTATATVEMSSIDTGNAQRDEHVRSGDFFEVGAHPTMTYRSTGIRRVGPDLIVDGELTLKGVTRSVPLTLEVGGIGPDAYGGTRAGFSAVGEINRKDFGVNFNATYEGGGLVVSDKVGLHLEIEAVLDTPAA